MADIRDWTVTDVVTAVSDPSADVEFPVHETNDVILLYLSVDGNNIPALPSGYTNIQNDFGTAESYRLCYKIAASANEVCPALSVTAEEWHITVISISGADTADPINVTAQRTANDNASPFTWANGQSTDETNVLLFQFICSDSGLAITAEPPWTNLQNGDAGSAGGSVAYSFKPAAGAITDCSWRGRANDSTVACLVGINDDGNGTRPAYADPTSVGSLIKLLHGGAIESDTYPVSLTLPFVACRNFSQVWMDNAGAFTDETTDMRDAGTADVTITNTNGNAWYFGYDYTFRSMILVISTAQSAGTIVWEYWNGSTWTSFTMTGVLTATGSVRFSWAALSGWASTSVNSVSKFYIRMRISATFTTAPILSEGHVGGYLTTFDAHAVSGDSGINPYQDAISLTPASTANFSGAELQFGAAQDLDTGVLILHHRGVLPRDYAVDPYKNDVTYPVTAIVNGRGGFVVALMDSNNDVEAYSIHGKGALSNAVDGWNVAAIGLNNGAEPFGLFRDALDKSAVTRILFLPQGGNGAMSAHVSQLSIVSLLVISGGSSGGPIDNDALVFVANNAFGKTLLFNGIGTYFRVYAPMQIGGADPINLAIDGITYAMPTTYDGKEYFDWNADDNVAGWTFYGDTGDVIAFTNCIWRGSQPYRWEFHASHVAGTEDFSGSQVIGATVTLRSTVALSAVSFKDCPTFTLNGANLDGCSFTDTKVLAGSPGDADDITNCTFVSSGTGHGLEIGGTVADITLTGLTFTGYAGTNGSTGNEAIYVNIASGTITITIDEGTTPSIRTAGATVIVVAGAVTVAVNVKDLLGSNLQNARVLIKAAAGGPFPFDETVTIVNSGTTATVTHTAHGMETADKVVIKGASLAANNGVFPITYINANSYSYTMASSPGSSPTGTIKATFVALEGLTDASGNISATRVYPSDQPISGWARKSSTPTYYKPAAIGGTVGSASGLSAAVQMIPDE